jgi:alanine dehydrogenase
MAMFIGVPKEIKADEYRVGLIPSTISELVAQGHDVVVETRAGQGAGIGDGEYTAAGARIAATADEIFKQSELIVKVKEPLASERMKAAARSDNLHLSALGSRSRADI